MEGIVAIVVSIIFVGILLGIWFGIHKYLEVIRDPAGMSRVPPTILIILWVNLFGYTGYGCVITFLRLCGLL